MPFTEIRNQLFMNFTMIFFSIKKHWFLTGMLLLSIGGYSQTYIDTKKESLVKSLQKYMRETGISDTLQVTDTLISLQIRDPKFKNADFVYYLDQNGVCIKEIRKSCDSCVSDYFKQMLTKHPSRWIQIHPTLALSKYFYHLMIAVINENGKTFFQATKLN